MLVIMRAECVAGRSLLCVACSCVLVWPVVTKRKSDPTPVPLSILLSVPWLLEADMDHGRGGGRGVAYALRPHIAIGSHHSHHQLDFSFSSGFDRPGVATRLQLYSRYSTCPITSLQVGPSPSSEEYQQVQTGHRPHPTESHAGLLTCHETPDGTQEKPPP